MASSMAAVSTSFTVLPDLLHGILLEKENNFHPDVLTTHWPMTENTT
jgi:hypothetical protein